jgi:hypothetical protein
LAGLVLCLPCCVPSANDCCLLLLPSIPCCCAGGATAGC